MEKYLIVYNALLAAGWMTILFLMVKHRYQGKDSREVFQRVEFLLKICQTAAVLEIVHAALRIVRSSVALTFFQVASRLIVLWPVTVWVPDVQDSIGVPLFLTCWTVTEIIRYSYYMLGLLHVLPYSLLWCRYTFFVLLYPIGVTGELITIYRCFKSVSASGQFSTTLPNALNFSISYPLLLVHLALLYIPIFPNLYFHMFAQRKKMLKDD